MRMAIYIPVPMNAERIREYIGVIDTETEIICKIEPIIKAEIRWINIRGFGFEAVIL